MLRAAFVMGLCCGAGLGQTSAGTVAQVPLPQVIAPGYVHSQPLVLDQMIVGISKGGIEARAMDGRVLWRTPVIKYLPTQLAAFDDTIVVIESYAYALNISDGSRKWTTRIASNGSLSQPVVYEGRVYFGTQNNLIYCLDADTGVVKWTRDISDGNPYPGVVRAAAVSGGNLIFATDEWGDESGLSVSGRLYLLSLQKGEKVWEYDTRTEKPATDRSGMSSTPVIADGVVYVSDALGGSLRAISLDTGALRWKASVRAKGAGILASPLVLGKQVFFGGSDGVVWIVDAASGTAITSHDLGSAIVDLRSCGSSLVATTWGAAVRLGAKALDLQRINDRLTVNITSKLADSPDRTSLIGFNGASLVRIICAQ